MPELFTTVTTAVWDGVGDVVTTISSNALMLIPIAVGFAGSLIGLAKGLLGFRRRRR